MSETEIPKDNKKDKEEIDESSKKKSEEGDVSVEEKTEEIKNSGTKSKTKVDLTWYIHNFFSHYLRFNHALASTLALFFFILMVAFKQTDIELVFLEYNKETKTNIEKPAKKNLGTIFLVLKCTTVLYIGLSIIIRSISFYLTSVRTQYRTTFFCLTYISEHISLASISFVALIISNTHSYNFYITNPIDFNIPYVDFLTIFLMTNLLFALVTGMSALIKIGFNRNSYADRILGVLRCDFFMQVLMEAVVFKRKAGVDDLKHVYINALPVELTKQRIDENKNGEKDIFDAYFSLKPCNERVKSWVYILFRKKKKSIIYSYKFDENDSFKKDKKIERIAATVSQFSRSNIRMVQDLWVFFDDIDRFHELLRILNVHKNTSLNDEHFFIDMMKKNREEQEYIEESLCQINSSVSSLQRILYFIIVILMIAYLCTISYQSPQTAVSLISAFFGTGFIFQASAKDAIDSIIFLFCIHPFDVGDRVFITIDNQCFNLIVKEMTILSTTFEKFDGTIQYIPNSVLCKKTIINVRRSNSMGEVHLFQIDSSTSKRRLDDLSVYLSKFVKANNDAFESASINVDSIENCNRMTVRVLVFHKNNWQMYEDYIKRKNEFLIFVIRTMDLLKIGYTLPTQKIFLQSEKEKFARSNA